MNMPDKEEQTLTGGIEEFPQEEQTLTGGIEERQAAQTVTQSFVERTVESKTHHGSRRVETG
jgi:hypothetical protein